MSPNRRDFVKAGAVAAAAAVVGPRVLAASRAAHHRDADGILRRRPRPRGTQRGARCRRAVRRRAHRQLPSPNIEHARTPDHRRDGLGVVRHRHSNARRRRVGICRDRDDDERRRRAMRARRRASVARGEEHDASPGGARAGRAGQGHVDHAGDERSDRRPDRGKSRAAVRDERSGAQGAEDSVLHVGPSTAARSEDARHDRRNAHHADVHSLRGVVQRDGGGQRNEPRVTPKSFRRAARAGSTSSRSNLPGNAAEWAQVPSRSCRRRRSSRDATISFSSRRISG